MLMYTFTLLIYYSTSATSLLTLLKDKITLRNFTFTPVLSKTALLVFIYTLEKDLPTL